MNGNIGNIGDMGAVLSRLMEDPESLGKVMNIASALSASGALGGMSPGNTSGAREPVSSDADGSDVGLQASVSASRGMSEANGTGRHTNTKRIRQCDRIRLLEAMRPFVSDDKRDKLEVVIKILGLADAAGDLYGNKR